MRIFLSDGHDSKFPGAKNLPMGKLEHEEIVKINDVLEETLTSQGFTVIRINMDSKIANYTKSSQNLIDKVKKINSEAGTEDIAIEMHLNAFNTEAFGFENLFFPGSELGKNLAMFIQNNMNEVFSEANAPHNRNRGIHERKDLYFIKKCNCTAIITEPFFLDNDVQAEFFLKNVDLIAKAVSLGVLDFANRPRI